MLLSQQSLSYQSNKRMKPRPMDEDTYNMIYAAE